MILRNVAVFFALLGLAWMAYAIRGIIRKEITTYPKGGRGCTYYGRAAVWQGLFELLLGLVVLAIALVLYLSSG
jgi:hypothetical protein